MEVKISNDKAKDTPQVIHLFTETTWDAHRSRFPESVSHFFKGKQGEHFVFIENDQSHYLIGLEKKPEKASVKKAAGNFSQKNKDSLQAVETSLRSNGLEEELQKEFIKGLYLGSYSYDFNSSHPVWEDSFKLLVPTIGGAALENFKKETLALCKGQFACMDWLNKPQNSKRTSVFVNFLKETAEKYKLSYEGLTKEQAEKEGLGAFLAVNQGSWQKGEFAILRYDVGDAATKSVGLVGKSVLFDTGGVSIKPSNNMHYMKSDMGGATAVLGTLIAAAEMELPVNIIAILPVTDNAVSEKSYTPSDVITAYNGKSIEVLDTDAEGRMTLADGLSYLSKNYQTDYLIDLATLTGSAVRTFGDTCGALFSNDKDLEKKLIDSGERTGQRLWPLPLWDVWKDDIQSDVADLKNISLKPVGDCIVAAKFLEHFIEGHPRWAHLDIAGVAFGNVTYAKEKAATGYGVQLLLDFMRKM